MKNIVILMLLFISGCSVEYSPYEVTVQSDEIDLTKNNRNKLYRYDREFMESYSFVLIADSHSWYDNLEKAVKHINKNKDIFFVIHLGDLASSGLVKEYRWTNDILKKLHKPYLTVIGNHDCLNNGMEIYKKMYGNGSVRFCYNDRSSNS